MAHNDAFRVIFSEAEGLPGQEFRSPETVEPCQLDYQDHSGESDPESACQRWMHHAATVPLAYQENKLYAFALLKKSDNEYFWYLKVHHTIADAWSLSLTIKKTALIYEGLMQSRLDFSAVASSYTDYIRDNLSYRGSALYKEDEQYWKARFAEVPAAASIGIKDGSKSEMAKSIRKTLYLDRAVYTGLQQFARQQGVTTFHAFSALLYVYFSG